MCRKCERCNKKARTVICSMYNAKMICMTCKKAEQERSDYKKVCELERQAVLSGNLNYIYDENI